MKRCFKACLAVLIFMAVWGSGSIFADDFAVENDNNAKNANNEISASDIAAAIDFGALNESLHDIENYCGEYYEDLDFSEVWQQVKQGHLDFKFQDFFQLLAEICFGDIKSCWGILLQILALAVISALMVNFSSNFGNQSALLGRSIIYLVLVSVILQSFVVCGSSVASAVALMSDFLYALFPIMLTLLVAMGGVSAVGLYHPLLMFCVTACINIINYFILPLIYCNAGLTVAGKLNVDFDLGGLSKLLRTVALGVLTITFALFSAITGIVGLGSASMDGVAMKTAKSAIGVFVPVIGRSIADIFGTIMGTALVLKNCLGIAGILMIVIICAIPAVKVLVMSWIFKLCGAFCQTLGDKMLASALTDLGGVLTVLFAVAAACGIFFFFLLAITMAMGNVNLAIS